MVSTLLKNISQNGNLPQIGVNIKNMWNNNHLAVLVLQNKDGKIHPSPSPNITSELWGHVENRGFLASNVSNCFPIQYGLSAACSTPSTSQEYDVGIAKDAHKSRQHFLTLACMISITGFPINQHSIQLSQGKNHPTFHYTGWLIGILILAYWNPHIIG